MKVVDVNSNYVLRLKLNELTISNTDKNSVNKFGEIVRRDFIALLLKGNLSGFHRFAMMNVA